MENEKKVIDLPETENEEVEVVDEGKMAKAKNFIKTYGFSHYLYNFAARKQNITKLCL